MASGGLITDYLSFGVGAPSAAPSVAPGSGEYAFYQNTTNGNLYVWGLNGTPAWTALGSGGGGTPTIATGSADLSADVTLAAGAWTDVLSLTPAAGTWVFFGQLTALSGAVETVTIRIFDGTNEQGSAAMTIAGTGYYSSASCFSGPLVLGGSTTIKLQGYTQSGATAATAKAAGTPSGSTKATHLRAMRVA